MKGRKQKEKKISANMALRWPIKKSYLVDLQGNEFFFFLPVLCAMIFLFMLFVQLDDQYFRPWKWAIVEFCILSYFLHYQYYLCLTFGSTIPLKFEYARSSIFIFSYLVLIPSLPVLLMVEFWFCYTWILECAYVLQSSWFI